MHRWASQTLLRGERRDVVLDNFLDFTFNIRRDITLRDLLQKRSLRGGQVSTELSFPFCDLVDGDGVKLWMELENPGAEEHATYKTVDTGIDDGHLELHGQGLVLALLCAKLVRHRSRQITNIQHTQELSQTSTTGEQEAGGSVEVGAKLSEGGDFTVLRKIQFQGTSELLHDLAKDERA